MRSGSLEARLLRASPGFEPPAHAQDEVWQRIKGLGAVGAAAGAFGLGGHSAAAAAKVTGTTLWLWAAGVGLAVAVPAAGVATYWVGHRAPGANKVVVVAATAPGANDTAGQTAPAESAQALVPVAEAPQRELPRGRSGSHALPSALKAESRLLATARARFAAGDPSGALDDVGRLAAQFPHGELVQEREVVAIDCLEALGDRAGARARALAFRERFPNSPYTAHVRQVLGP